MAMELCKGCGNFGFVTSLLSYAHILLASNLSPLCMYHLAFQRLPWLRVTSLFKQITESSMQLLHCRYLYIAGTLMALQLPFQKYSSSHFSSGECALASRDCCQVRASSFL